MKVTCPTCKAEVIWDANSPHRPFCSKRCQLIDLGEWAEEEHKISTPLVPAGLKDQPSAEAIEEIEAMLAANEQDFFKH